MGKWVEMSDVSILAHLVIDKRYLCCALFAAFAGRLGGRRGMSTRPHGLIGRSFVVAFLGVVEEKLKSARLRIY